jgi:hypothetical protein
LSLIFKEKADNASDLLDQLGVPAEDCGSQERLGVVNQRVPRTVTINGCRVSQI